MAHLLGATKIMKRKEFINNKNTAAPQIDEKILGPMILEALKTAELELDDNVENRDRLKTLIDSIVNNIKYEAVKDELEKIKKTVGRREESAPSFDPYRISNPVRREIYTTTDHSTTINSPRTWSTTSTSLDSYIYLAQSLTGKFDIE